LYGEHITPAGERKCGESNMTKSPEYVYALTNPSASIQPSGSSRSR
jgi:hypothetical protein